MCISLCKEYDPAYTSLQQFVVYEKVGLCIRCSLFLKNPCARLNGYAMIRASSDVMTNVGKKLKQSDGRLAQLVERIPYKD
jgi:hypothetical protein